MDHQISLGLDTFGDVTLGPDGKPKRQDEVLRDVVEEAELADAVGIDFIGLGEHHRSDFAISSPEVVLAAIAGRTKRIKLGSAVTVLSSDDPVRVFQRFSTLNAISNGRAEVILGRGSFSESYPLFGYDMADYDILFEEKLDLFAKLVREDRVTWAGQTRTGLTDQVVYPPLGPEGMQVWVGVGGSPESVVRVVRQDLQLMLAIIGGDPRRFVPYVDLYHRAVKQLGREARPVGVHSPGFVAATDEAAQEQLWPHYQAMFGRIGRERGWPPVTKERYLDEVRNGSLYVGSPETVARKIAATVKALGLQRFDMKYSTGPQPHDQLMEAIRLYGERVIPMVREMLAEKSAA
ncbi:MAG: LLM class flavin-dependent oxidoreductase [Tabrizicola sp.]|uniref:LLM class flavin-dependent oxidoreductase n=1 Tax=Tabrizicola sp. TaxID=2005166 RepID=UPI002735DC01|nr:LLM class flavin-dependent oxidoreductase [Tabrizicola sp.]MDP3264761.1 LLM class flavin-dependent oxidoreductase [Tabrizicola sp.]MDP3647496.1 LLM class flavin-dependent oxidoreductase [Paracoccaceae bacterium]MDZ4067024.1 LLM class flavin-dependent oxidoreductase [Tabrizicola sp.]